MANHQAFVAEVEGFEPPDPVKGLRFSRPTHSTTLPNLLRNQNDTVPSLRLQI